MSGNMSAPEIVVVDYGVGNLLSVRRGLEHCGAGVTLSADPAAILAAPRVLLPGVGAFANGVEELRQRGLDTVVREVAAKGTPLLGICLGMQMLLDESEEFGVSAGLGLIPGRVVGVPTALPGGGVQKVPHIGWNSLHYAPGRADWRGSILEDVAAAQEAVYFVHSFMAQPESPADRLADCYYGGVPIAAVVARNNVVGCQFHPEKSGVVGQKILRKFLTL